MLWRLGIRWCITHIDSPGRKKNKGNFGQRHFALTFKLILENTSRIPGSFIRYLRQYQQPRSPMYFFRILKPCLKVCLPDNGPTSKIPITLCHLFTKVPKPDDRSSYSSCSVQVRQKDHQYVTRSFTNASGSHVINIRPTYHMLQSNRVPGDIQPVMRVIIYQT